MKLNRRWNLAASMVVVAALTVTQMNTAAFAQAATVKKADNIEQIAKAVAPARSGAAPQAGTAKSKKKGFWILLGVGAAMAAAIVGIANSNSNTTPLPPPSED